MAEQKTYHIPAELQGQDVWVSKPPYERKDGAKFTLDPDVISQKDLQWLHESGECKIVCVTRQVKKETKKEDDKGSKK